MKLLHFFSIILVLCFHPGFSQQVALDKVEKIHPNQDRFLYKVSLDNMNKVFLGIVSIRGNFIDDPAVFSAVYHKAKEIGANSFLFKPYVNVDGSLQSLDPFNYQLALYYTPADKIDDYTNWVYFLNSSGKSKKISINGGVVSIPARSFFRVKLEDGKIYSASTRSFLGSGLKLSAHQKQPEQFFLVSGAKVKANPYGSAGINFKTGDFVVAERSYGDFLSVVYSEVKP